MQLTCDILSRPQNNLEQLNEIAKVWQAYDDIGVETATFKPCYDNDVKISNDKLKVSYPYVDIIFGTHTLHKLPEDVYKKLNTSKKIKDVLDIDGKIYEGLPIKRSDKVKASVTIMNGCNNFCSYCIVPYVRGRERSRKSEDILNEINELAGQGYKEIMLLGQNVNSYNGGCDFATLLDECASFEGEYRVRFMTSHPKDASTELIEVISRNKNVAKHFHLPVQSGSSRVLKLMNRKYTREQYLEKAFEIKEKIPEISLTTDIICGFPTETDEDFSETMSLVKEVGFTSLFTFIYSPRKGTPAAEMEDPIPAETKSAWFQELSAVQEAVSAESLAKLVGTEQRALLESVGEGFIEARLASNSVVRVQADPALIGRHATIRIDDARSWIMNGTVLSVEE